MDSGESRHDILKVATQFMLGYPNILNIGGHSCLFWVALHCSAFAVPGGVIFAIMDGVLGCGGPSDNGIEDIRTTHSRAKGW